MALWDAQTLEELLARDFSRLSPAVRTRTEQLARSTSDGATVTERWTFYPKGHPVTVQAVISAYPLPNGRKALLFEATPIDLEDGERRAVEALRHTSSLITLFTSDGTAIFANPAAVAAYGDDVGFCDRFADAAYGSAVLEAVQSGNVLAELVEISSLFGVRSHHIDARQVLDPVTGGVSILLSERDVTAQVEAERALLVAEERAAVAVAKEQFLSNVSHELRTPLTSVLGYSALLKTEERLTPEAHARLDKISEAGENLLEIINNVIMLGEIDKGEIQIQLSNFAVSDLLQEVAEEIRQSATRKGLNLQVEPPSNIHSIVVGDRKKLHQILHIFATNAVKFTASGEVVVGATVEPLSASAVQVSLYVRDTGPGVRVDDQVHIFERFSRADQGRMSAGGTGLGLAISRTLALALSGEVEVTSTFGEGSTFILRVPLEIAGSDSSEIELPSGDLNTGTSLQILYADDHENNRTLVSAVLFSQGHKCDLVENGRQAVMAASNKAYDLILMDIQMPIMDGIAATREIRRLPLHAATPVVALTANTQSTQLEEYADAGLNDCIAKPFRLPDLIQKVSYWCMSSHLSSLSHTR